MRTGRHRYATLQLRWRSAWPSLLLVLVLDGCGGEGAICRVGESIACTGSGGCSGFQVCRDDGSGFDPCICQVPDASAAHDGGFDFDGGNGLDGGREVDGGRDAGLLDLDAGGTQDSGGVLDSGADAGSDRPPRSSCSSRATLFPDPIVVTGEASDPDDDLITAVSWRLASIPTGSSAAFTDPETPSFTFTPDVPGYYIFCITVEAAGLASGETCCSYTSVDDFEWAFVPARSTRYVEEIEISAGRMELSFDVNQGFSRTTGTYTVSDPGFVVAGTGGATSVHRVSVQPSINLAVSDPDAVTAGDTITLMLRGDPVLTGPSDSMITGTIVLENAPEPGLSTPAIVSVETGPLFAGTAARIAVRFDSARPAGDRLVMGGWDLPTVGVTLIDDGTGDDLVARDGWYSGRFRAPSSGTYEILLVPRVSNVFGPYYRHSLTVP